VRVKRFASSDPARQPLAGRQYAQDDRVGQMLGNPLSPP
jgi:hypothetical protein